MTVQDLYRVLVDTQFIEIHNPITIENCSNWSGRAKDIPSCYFDSNIIKVYSIYKSNTESTHIVVHIE